MVLKQQWTTKHFALLSGTSLPELRADQIPGLTSWRSDKHDRQRGDIQWQHHHVSNTAMFSWGWGLWDNQSQKGRDITFPVIEDPRTQRLRLDAAANPELVLYSSKMGVSQPKSTGLFTGLSTRQGKLGAVKWWWKQTGKQLDDSWRRCNLPKTKTDCHSRVRNKWRREDLGDGGGKSTPCATSASYQMRVTTGKKLLVKGPG